MSNPAARPEAPPLVAAAVPPPDAEWLLVDGQGGYACGSVDDLARRRYHGWWNVRRPGSARRWS
ncbi:MAG: glycogen debranching enzyme N-terminal domain-containing protein, partial [Planctomycetes bacterium]|nr:glycogen debranching enzyme N-terminal domain-containing protein [Planctomycetota bacterium]